MAQLEQTAIRALVQGCKVGLCRLVPLPSISRTMSGAYSTISVLSIKGWDERLSFAEFDHAQRLNLSVDWEFIPVGKWWGLP
jgi:hypothetical protein